MKKIFTFAFVALVYNQSSAQVGINTTTPQATLDVAIPPNYVNGAKAGIAIPQLTGNQVEAISITGLKSGTMVYATEASTASSKDVNSVGYWYWKNNTEKWEPFLQNAPRFFYSPSIPINTSVSSGTIDLYTNYQTQFSAPKASSAGSVGAIPIYTATQLEYYVTWFDATIFTNVTISATGVMNYSVLPSADTSKPTFMNVVFVVKQ